MTRHTSHLDRIRERNEVTDSPYSRLKDAFASGPRPRLSRTAALRELGPVVYAARIDGLVKIGFTKDLAHRLGNLGGGDVLAFMAGDFATERAIHERLRDHRVQGREGYEPVPAVLEVVNEMRERIGLEPLAG